MVGLAERRWWKWMDLRRDWGRVVVVWGVVGWFGWVTRGGHEVWVQWGYQEWVESG